MSNNHFTQASYNAGTRVNQYQKDCRIGKWCQKSSCQYFAIPSFRCPFAFLLLYSCYPFAIPHHCKNPDPGIPLGFLAPISGQMDCGQMGDRKYDLSLKVRKKYGFCFLVHPLWDIRRISPAGYRVVGSTFMSDINIPRAASILVFTSDAGICTAYAQVLRNTKETFSAYSRYSNTIQKYCNQTELT